MKIVILGATGMIGHKLTQVLEKTHSVIPVSRKPDDNLNSAGLFNSKVEVVLTSGDLSEYKQLFRQSRPDVVINCIGIIKQKKDAENRNLQIYANALFPHLLSDICEEAGCRLIHFSTDCVFSGKEGNYSESSISDVEDLYGKTKYIGELSAPHCLTLRTSAIGHELRTRYSLIEWLLSHPSGSSVHGYTKAIYSGFPTVCLAELINKILTLDPPLGGLYHLSSNPISKFDLLTLVADTYDLGINILPDDSLVCDRSLDSRQLRTLLNYEPSSWKSMVNQMYEDYIVTDYKSLKQKYYITGS